MDNLSETKVRVMSLWTVISGFVCNLSVKKGQCYDILTTRIRSLQGGNVFSSVCLSYCLFVHRGYSCGRLHGTLSAYDMGMSAAPALSLAFVETCSLKAPFHVDIWSPYSDNLSHPPPLPVLHLRKNVFLIHLCFQICFLIDYHIGTPPPPTGLFNLFI